MEQLLEKIRLEGQTNEKNISRKFEKRELESDPTAQERKEGEKDSSIEEKCLVEDSSDCKVIDCIDDFRTRNIINLKEAEQLRDIMSNIKTVRAVDIVLSFRKILENTTISRKTAILELSNMVITEQEKQRSGC